MTKEFNREDLVNLSGQIINGIMSSSNTQLEKLVDGVFLPKLLAKFSVSMAKDIMTEIDKTDEEEEK